MPLPLNHFKMIRHGQTTANADGKLSGITNVELSDQGRQEAASARDIFAALEDKPSIIIHSKLTRAKHTAEIINEALNLDLIEHPEIHEQNFGDWENKGIGLYLESYVQRSTPKNGESFDEFDDRIRGALTDILNTHKNPLIVCHGGVFRSFHSLYKQGHFFVDNAMPYAFTPNATETDIPWDITPIR